MIDPETGRKPACSWLRSLWLALSFPFPFLPCFSPSHTQTPFLWEALPDSRPRLSLPRAYVSLSPPPSALRLWAFMPISFLDWELLEGRTMSFVSRGGPGSLLNGSQHPFSSPFSPPLSIVVFILLLLGVQDCWFLEEAFLHGSLCIYQPGVLVPSHRNRLWLI